MKRKIVGIFVCMLLLISIIPISGIASNVSIDQDPNQNYRIRVKHLDDGRLPPIPGDIQPGFIFQTNEITQIISEPPIKPLDSSEETIIEILENIDEDLILGFLEDLVAFGPRFTGTNACELAGDYIYNEFVSYGLNARYDDWTYGSYSSNNIEGTLPGVDPSSDEIYIICGHYDSVSGSPGADDDGSGTVAVLAAAKIMSQFEFNHTIKFVAFSGEEQGLLGSYRYAQEAYGNGDNIVAVLNGDMIGYATNPTEASMIKIYENSASSWITDFTEDVSQNYDEYFELTVVPSGPSSGSDHASFWDFGFHAVFDHEYKFNPYWHTSQDTIANMDMDYDTRCSRLMIATLGELAEAQIMNEPPETPDAPSGPLEWRIDIQTTFTSSTTDPEEDSIYYMFDWGDGAFSEWEGPYASGDTGSAVHIWTELGEYEVRVIAKDTYNSISEWSEPAIINIVLNQPPNTPTISGEQNGNVGTEYEYTFNAVDPDDDNVKYHIDWDDGDTETTDFFSSGTDVKVKHTWTNQDTYIIRVTAEDTHGLIGPEGTLTVTMPRNRAIMNIPFLQFLQNFLQQYPILYQLLLRFLQL